MKVCCNSSLDRMIRCKHYATLNTLRPPLRAAEKFRYMTESLDFEVRSSDEIIGWFLMEQCECPQKEYDDEIPDEAFSKLQNTVTSLDFSVKIDKGHTLPDYEMVLKRGLVYYETKLNRELTKAPNNEYLLAMKQTIDVVKHFTERIIRWLSVSADKLGGERAEHFIQMLKKVPFYPAESFTEAVQSLWIVHFLIPLAESAWCSISLGKLDEYLLPYYQCSLEKGMTRGDAKKVIRNFYELLNSYADGACLVNVGGNYNELSKLLIECQAEFSMPAPILGARINCVTPDDIWDDLIDERLFTMGQPTFYAEPTCIEALVEKGIPYEEATKFSNVSCMGIGIPGKEFNSMWGLVFNSSAALESAVNCGNVIGADFYIPEIGKANSLKQLYENFEKSVIFLLNLGNQLYCKTAEQSESCDPDPFISLLTDSCIEKHCDRISGADYHNVTVECMGLVNVSDGICAIDKLVYNEGKYSLEEMCQAVKNSFVGSEHILQDILNCPKYGQNSTADQYAVQVAEIMQKTIRALDNGRRFYLPSLHTLHSNVKYGLKWGAGFDGRLAGAPFAKNAGCSNFARQNDPTSLILSAAKLPQRKFYGGQPIDVNFQTGMVRNRKKEIRALIEIYFQNGGLQFQVNSVSSELLRKALENPEAYPDLVVRIGGFSRYFNSLTRQTKLEFIERFEKEGF